MNSWKTLLLSGGLAAGCVTEDPPSSPTLPQTAPPEHLEQVTVAPDFRFKTTRPVEVHLERPAGAVVGVELRKENGSLLYSGAVPAGGLRLRLPLPLEDKNLRASWTIASGERREDVIDVSKEQP